MKKIPKSRFDKIRLLKDLQSGKISIRDIKGEDFNIWILIDGIYRNERTKEKLTPEQYEQYNFTGNNLILIEADGCDPIED